MSLLLAYSSPFAALILALAARPFLSQEDRIAALAGAFVLMAGTYLVMAMVAT